MFNHSQKRETERRKFQAAVMGADLKGGDKPKGATVIDGIEYNGDPESVANLSKEEKEELTRKLMRQHGAPIDKIPKAN